MSIQSKSKEFVDEENDNPTSNNNSDRGDALETILKSQLEIINPDPVKDIALENKINKLIIVQVKKKINSLKTIVGDFPILRDGLAGIFFFSGH